VTAHPLDDPTTIRSHELACTWTAGNGVHRRTVDATLDDFTFCGSHTSQFRQNGNAVPPLLAEHILSAIATPSTLEAVS
jgi:site-specific DNA-cytosine methylase